MTGKQEPDASGKLDFYISHAGPDRQWAEWVRWQLETAGYTVVLDWLPGENVVLAREDALRRAGHVLALCSRAYFRRGFTEQEWTAVLAAQQQDAPPLIPVWIEDLTTEDQLPRLLRSAQPIKLFGLSDAEAARRLVSSLSGEPGASGPAAFPGSGSSAEPQPDDGSKPRLPSQDHPAVWHVPPRNADFVGRDSVLVRVREELLGGSPGIVVLQGPGGMGKTQLSLEYAHRFGSDYDAVWVIDAEQPELVTSQLANLAVALSAVPAGTDAQLAATAALVALRNRKRWLLVFDNLEGPDDLAAFLPDGPGHVLVTTRAGMWHEIGHVIEVDEFTRAESTTLLTTRARSLTLTDADLVADAVGDLPLALAQAAGILQSGFPAAEFRQALDTEATQVLSRGKPGSYPATLAAATLLALDKLTAAAPEAANLLCLCAYLAPESIPATWFSRDTQEPSPADSPIGALPTGTWHVTRVYERIRDIGLGRVDQKGLRLHRLTQAILRDRTAEHRTAYRDRIVSVLTGAAPPNSTDPVMWPRWSELVPHLLVVTAEIDSAALRPLANAAVRYLLFSGQTQAALTMTTRLHRDWTARLGPDDPDVLTAAQHLAHAIFNGGDYAKAAEIQTETLDRRRRVLGEDHPDTLHSANDLSVVVNALGRLKEALALGQDAYDRRRRTLGEDHPDTLTSAGNLAGTLQALGRLKEALALNQDAYNRCRRTLGEDHPDTLASAGNLAGTLHALGRPKEALALNQDAYDRHRRTLGEDHPKTLTSANSLAGTLHALGRPKEALALNQDAYDRHRRTLGEDHPDTLTSAGNLAGTLHALGRPKEALALNQDTYNRQRRALGEDHPNTLTYANNLAGTLQALGRLKEALALNQDTYNRHRRALGEDHPNTLTSASNLAGTLHALGRLKEALALNQDTYNRQRRTLGEDHPDTLASASNLADTLRALGRLKEALALNQDTYDRRRRTLGEDHPNTLASANNLAGTLRALGRHQEALALNQETHARCRRVLGEGHPDTLTSAANLALNLERLGRRWEALQVRAQTPQPRKPKPKKGKGKKKR